ncbi:Uncharacterised protein [Mycoplasmopsis maculosa]|uniref:Uncharacterized protein n=1 Tax=Mycoplasmopsis maculosa TaxID=114885 RepID=A0A449B4D2_9BACT|nr:hypothetical protein [Mycoplasmopsis maculosa]VEU75461.1 Uncharacterised protein [Mycoplasmopsis maculosa]
MKLNIKKIIKLSSISLVTAPFFVSASYENETSGKEENLDNVKIRAKATISSKIDELHSFSDLNIKQIQTIEEKIKKELSKIDEANKIDEVQEITNEILHIYKTNLDLERLVALVNKTKTDEYLQESERKIVIDRLVPFVSEINIKNSTLVNDQIFDKALKNYNEVRDPFVKSNITKYSLALSLSLITFLIIIISLSIIMHKKNKKFNINN